LCRRLPIQSSQNRTFPIRLQKGVFAGFRPPLLGFVVLADVSRPLVAIWRSSLHPKIPFRSRDWSTKLTRTEPYPTLGPLIPGLGGLQPIRFCESRKRLKLPRHSVGGSRRVRKPSTGTAGLHVALTRLGAQQGERDGHMTAARCHFSECQASAIVVSRPETTFIRQTTTWAIARTDVPALELLRTDVA